MMTLYTKEAPDNLNKGELLVKLMSLQNKIKVAKNDILKEIRKFNHNSFRLNQGYCSEAGKFLTNITKRLVEMEQQYCRNVQKSRRESLEVACIPDTVQDT